MIEYKTIGDINQYIGKNINPLKVSEEIFEMYSVPSFEGEYPEIIKGSEIGSSKQTVEVNDILLCKINPRINRVWRVSDFTNYRNIASSEWIVVRSDEMYSKYLMWYFRSDYFRKLMVSNVTGMGGSLMRAQPKQVEKYLVPVVNYELQVKISDILDKSEQLINKRKEQIKMLDELVKSKFIEMFGSLNRNTKNWEINKLDELINVIGGYAFKSTEFTDEGIPVLKIGNINAGYFRTTNLMFWERDEKLEKYLIKPNDLVISLTGTVGKDDYGNVCIMGDNYNEYYLNQRNAKLEIKLGSKLNKYYLTNLLKVPEIKQKLTSISRGVRQANIANKDILNLEVPIPPIEIQNEFEVFIKQVDKLKFEMESSLKELEDNFNSLMQKAFKGELFN